jgi:hypothetical protein
MTREVRRLDSKAVRSRLKVREAPYWVRCGARGCHLGYRRLQGGFGTWLAKYRNPATGKRLQEALGAADDVLPADGDSVLSWEQAEAKAREFFGRRSKAPVQGGKLTVSAALDEYFTHRELNGKAKAIAGDRKSVAAHIVPKLGAIEIRKVTKADLRQWRDDLAKTPARRRSPKGVPQQYQAMPETDDGKRARRATTNRVWAILRAALTTPPKITASTSQNGPPSNPSAVPIRRGVASLRMMSHYVW